MDRAKLDEIELIIMDLQMAMGVKEQIEAGEERGLVDFSDGEKIKVPIPSIVKEQLDGKIVELTKMLKGKVATIGG